MRLGGILPGFHLAYETWGELSAGRKNVILLQTGLSPGSHARSRPDAPEPGWWEEFVGPGLALDTNRFFIVCVNVLGSCHGSTGPASIDPRTKRPFALGFPSVTIEDMVRSQRLLLAHLGVDRLHAAVGSSMGGMQSLAYAALFPDEVANVVSISAAARSYPWSIAVRFIQRQAVLADPEWKGGDYYGGRGPLNGLHVARQIGTLSYRGAGEWEPRFGRARVDRGPDLREEALARLEAPRGQEHSGPTERTAGIDPRSGRPEDAGASERTGGAAEGTSSAAEGTSSAAERTLGAAERTANSAGSSHEANPLALAQPAAGRPGRRGEPEFPDRPGIEAARRRRFGVDFQVESYLAHQGDKFVRTYDANSYLYVSKAMDLFDLGEGQPTYEEGVGRIRARALIVGVPTDLLFPISLQQEIAEILISRGRDARCLTLDSIYGHDSFLVEVEALTPELKGFLET